MEVTLPTRSSAAAQRSIVETRMCRRQRAISGRNCAQAHQCSSDPILISNYDVLQVPLEAGASVSSSPVKRPCLLPVFEAFLLSSRGTIREIHGGESTPAPAPCKLTFCWTSLAFITLAHCLSQLHARLVPRSPMPRGQLANVKAAPTFNAEPHWRKVAC